MTSLWSCKVETCRIHVTVQTRPDMGLFEGHAEAWLMSPSLAKNPQGRAQ